VHGWARPAEAGERLVTTLLVIDIVDSTKVAVRLGDAAWKELLARHNEGVRIQLDRFRGVEVYTTGDGLLAFFDGAARAVRCAAAVRDGALQDGLQIRAGVHSGEVERDAGNLRGVAVHAVTRIAALANPGDVLVSVPTASLLEGGGLQLEDAGEHELKGLAGARRVYRLIGLASDQPLTPHGGALAFGAGDLSRVLEQHDRCEQSDDHLHRTHLRSDAAWGFDGTTPKDNELEAAIRTFLQRAAADAGRDPLRSQTLKERDLQERALKLGDTDAGWSPYGRYVRGVPALQQRAGQDRRGPTDRINGRPDAGRRRD
jgi:class 3 adenylate cyclase